MLKTNSVKYLEKKGLIEYALVMKNNYDFEIKNYNENLLCQTM